MNDNYGAGAVASTSISGVQYGIEATADSGGTGDVTVNVGTDASISTSTGSSGLFGIDAFSTDIGNITVTMSTGDSVTSGSAGIVAVNWAAALPTSSAITVTAEGTINSGANLQDGNPPAGILAGYNPDNSDASDPSVAGSVSVTSDATITAVAGFGIWAFTFGTGNITVSTSAQSVITSGSAEIVAVNLATTDPASSAIAVTTEGVIDSGPNTQDGGFPSAGILAGYNPNNAGTPNSDVAGNVSVTSDATINAAGGYGIWAFNFGTGNVAVTTEADSSITASGSAIDTPDGVVPPIGIGAYAFDGGNASISNDGTVAASAGIALLANSTGGFGTGTATITNDGTVSGDGTSANPVVEITAGAATLTNAGTIEAPSASGLAIAEFGTITLNNSGTIIGEVALGEATFNIQSGGVWDVSGPSSFNTGSTIDDAGTINAIGNTDITSANVTLNLGSATSTGYLWNDDLTNSGAILTLDAGLTIDQTGNAAIYSTNATTAINDSVVSYATINASAAYTFYIQPDFFTNYGQINADSSGGTLDIIPTGSFTNYGTVAVSNGENATIGNGSVSDTQPGSAINEPAGVISVSGAGSSLSIAASSFTNDGTLQVNSAAALNINSNVENLGGMIETSGSDSSVELANATITDGATTIGIGGTLTLNDGTLTGFVGTLTIDNSGVIDVVTSNSAINFSDLTNESGSASIQIEDVRVTFDDTTVSGGAITETGASAQINVDAGEQATFENTTLTLSNTTAANGAVLVAGELTLESTVTIAGTGAFTIANGGTLAFDGSVGDANTVDNNGTVEVQSGAFTITSNVSGGGSFEIGNGATLELGGTSTNTMTFQGSTGTLQIDSSGTTSPFYVNGGGVALPAGDAIYLPNVSFDQAADSYNPTTDVITVSNGSADGTVTIDVVGGIANNDTFVFSQQGSGTLIEDPEIAPAHHQGGLSVTIGGPGNDNFVFHPANATDTSVHWNAQQDAGAFDHVADAELGRHLALFITGGDGDAVTEYGYHDASALPDAATTQLQQIAQAHYIHSH